MFWTAWTNSGSLWLSTAAARPRPTEQRGERNIKELIHINTAVIDHTLGRLLFTLIVINSLLFIDFLVMKEDLKQRREKNEIKWKKRNMEWQLR